MIFENTLNIQCKYVLVKTFRNWKRILLEPPTGLAPFIKVIEEFGLSKGTSRIIKISYAARVASVCILILTAFVESCVECA